MAEQEQLHDSDKPLDRIRVDAVCAKLAELPIRDSRSADEIVGYDEFGIPR